MPLRFHFDRQVGERLRFEEIAFVEILEFLRVGSPRVDQTLLFFDDAGHLSHQVMTLFRFGLSHDFLEILAAGLNGVDYIAQLLVLLLYYLIELNYNFLLPIL